MCITSFADLPDSVSDCRRRTRPASAWNAGETGGEEDAAHPGRNATWGKLRDVERPACLQRQTGACRSCGMASYCHPAGMRNRTERHEHSDRSVPAFEAGSGEQGSIHRPHHAAGRRLSLLGRPFGEQRSILCGSSRAWDGPSRFLERETLGKPETELSITALRRRWQ